MYGLTTRPQTWRLEMHPKFRSANAIQSENTYQVKDTSGFFASDPRKFNSIFLANT